MKMSGEEFTWGRKFWLRKFRYESSVVKCAGEKYTVNPKRSLQSLPELQWVLQFRMLFLSNKISNEYYVGYDSLQTEDFPHIEMTICNQVNVSKTGKLKLRAWTMRQALFKHSLYRN